MGKKHNLTPTTEPPRQNLQAERNGVPPDALTDLSHITSSLRFAARPLTDLAFMANNPLEHPEQQIKDLMASLRDLGQLVPLVVNVRPTPHVVIGGNGRLTAMLRLNWTHAAVTEVDVDEPTANKIAVALNATQTGGGWDDNALRSIMDTIQTADQEFAEMFTRLAEEEGIIPDSWPLKQLDIHKPPVMTWVLLGIPTVRFGEIAETVERLAGLPEVFCETTSNDG